VRVLPEGSGQQEGHLHVWVSVMCAKSSVFFSCIFGNFDYGAGGRLCTARIMCEELAVSCVPSPQCCFLVLLEVLITELVEGFGQHEELAV
jgi:hypothetical protein